MIDYIFDLCVRILQSLAAFFGMSYRAINVWIFCVLWPLLTLFLIGVIIRQRRTIARLRKPTPETKME